MDTKKFLIGTLLGGIVFFFLGFITYAILLADFFAAHAGSAVGVAKEELQYWPLILGDLAQAAMLTYILLNWAKAKSFVEGAKVGILIGFLMTLGHNMISYDTTNIADLTAALADVIVYTIITSIVGGVIAAVVGKGS